MAKSDCILRTKYKKLGWEICRRTDLTFNDIYIYYHEVVDEDVIMLKGKFAGYVDGFWQQSHWRRYAKE